MKELLEAIAKALVDNPDQVQVRAIEGETATVFELRVHPIGTLLIPMKKRSAVFPTDQ